MNDATDVTSAQDERCRSAENGRSVPSIRHLSRNLEFLSREFQLLSSRLKPPSSPHSAPSPDFLLQTALPPIREVTGKSPNGTPPSRNGRLSMPQKKPARRSFTLGGRPEAASPAVASAANVSPGRCDNDEPRRLSAAPRGVIPSVRTRDGRIRVVVRKRPMAPDDSGTDAVSVNSPWVHVSIKKQRVDLTDYEEVNDFMFDDAFSEQTTNMQLFEVCSRDLLDTALKGGSASCFAYGQTGSGKTHTMLGNGEEKGLYFLAVAELFTQLLPEHEVHASLYEIYRNSLFDLLNNRFPVVLREDHHHRINICGLSWHKIASVEDMVSLIDRGTDQRRTSSTSANERSSRSHAVLTIRIHHSGDASFCGTLNFVDLAGSERASDTATEDKQTRQEGAEINKSLLALKECIRALDEKKKHVPFRGSKLTEILRDSFMGNSQTVMIANVSASSCNYEHTVNTLRYAFRVKGLSVPSVTPSKARNAPRPMRQAGNDIAALLNLTNGTTEDSLTGQPNTPLKRKPRPRGFSAHRTAIRSRTPNAGHMNIQTNIQNSNMIVSPQRARVNADDSVLHMNLHALAHEKVLNIISSANLREKIEPNENSITSNTPNGLTTPRSSPLEQQWVIELVNQVVGSLKLEVESSFTKAVQKRDRLIRKLRGENIALRASLAALEKKMEECKYCKRHLGTPPTAPITF